MAWENSRILRSFITDALGGTAFDLRSAADSAGAGDPLKVALFGNGITPDYDVDTAAAAYGGGVWLPAGEVADGDQWPVAGQAIGGQSWGRVAAGLNRLTADPTASGDAATLTDVYGGLVYDTAVAAHGLSYNHFGGAQSVTNGTFTVVWSASGILQLNTSGV